MAKSTAAIEIEVVPKGNAESTVKSFKTQLKEAKIEAQQLVATFGEFSNEALAGQQKVANLSDQMEDFNDRVKALNPDKFAKVQTVVNGVASGFSAAQGAMALFGSESEDLQKTLVKVQGAMALAQGLEGLGKVQQQFMAIGKSITGPVIAAFKSFGAAARTAIASTGIGVLLVALGAIVAYWDDIKMALTGVNKETEKLNKATSDNLKKSKEQTDQFELQVNSLKLQGKSEKEIEELRIKAYDNEIERNIERLNFLKTTQKAQVDAVQSNFEFVNTGLKIFQAPLIALLKIIDVARKALGQESNLANQATESVASLLFDPKATKEKSDAEIKAVDQAIQELKSRRDASRLSIKKAEQEQRKTSSENSKSLIKTEAQLQAQLLVDNAKTLQEKIDAAKATFELEKADLIKQGVSKKIIKELENGIIEKVTKDFNDKVKADNDKLIAEEKANTDAANKILLEAYDEYYGEQILQVQKSGKTKEEIEKEVALLEIENLEAKLVSVQDTGDATIEIETQIFEKRKAIKDKEAADDLEREKNKQEGIYNIANSSLSALSSLNEAFASDSEESQKRAFEIDKALKYASTIMATIQGTQEAFSSANKSPITAIFPAYPYVQAGAALAFGLANLKKISDTKFQSKSSPSAGGNRAAGGGGGVPQMEAPRMSSLGNGNELTQDRRVYVTEGDISRTQKRVSNNQSVSVVE
jgi:hypothetical protein